MAILRLVSSPATADRQWLEERILAFCEHPAGAARPPEVAALQAGLLLFNDRLEMCHRTAQSIEGEAGGLGDYWHGLMHRREPDYTNTRYWFNKIGRQSMWGELERRVDLRLSAAGASAAGWRERLLAGGRWDPFAFIELCQFCAGDEDSMLARLARQIQHDEMQLLLAETHRAAAAAGFSSAGPPSCG
jgi:hypothetical protein